MNTSERVTPANNEQSVLSFDGKDDYVVFPPIVADFSNGLTVEAFVRYFSFKRSSRIIDFGNGAGSYNLILFNKSTSKTLSFWIYPDHMDADILEAGVWMHLAGTVDKDGISALYKDGEAVKSEIKMRTPPSVVRKINYVGKSHWPDGYFHGQIADLRFWNICRTKDEINATMLTRLKGNEAGLIGYWPMNKGSGNVLEDKTSAGNHAVFIS